MKNITRYTYEKTAFQGWRVCICRNWNHFIRYFSDRRYGGEEPALDAAVRVRDAILSELALPDTTTEQVFEKYKKLELPPETPQPAPPQEN